MDVHTGPCPAALRIALRVRRPRRVAPPVAARVERDGAGDPEDGLLLERVVVDQQAEVLGAGFR